jgi:hypothetical protein
MKPELLPDRTASRAASLANGETGGERLRGLGGGRLPERRPDSIWGGPGAGAGCAICDVQLSSDEMELEIEFAREDGFGADRYHVHVACFAAWEAELRKAEAVASPLVLPKTGEKRQNGARDDLSPRRGRP